MDAVTHIYSQNHCEESSAEKRPRLHSERETPNICIIDTTSWMDKSFKLYFTYKCCVSECILFHSLYFVNPWSHWDILLWRELFLIRPYTHTVPVFPSFILKHTITVLDLLSGHSVDSDGRILLRYFQERIEDTSVPVLPHVPLRAPEHVRGVCRLLEIVVLVFHQQGDAGVRHNPNTGAVPYVVLKPQRGCIVHPDHACDLVYLFSDAGSEHLTWAGDQGTLAAARVQELLRKGTG